MSVFVYLYKHIFCLIVLSFQFLFFYFSACKRIYVNMSDTNMKFDVFATLLILNGSEQSITTKQRHFICILHRCWIQILYAIYVSVWKYHTWMLCMHSRWLFHLFHLLASTWKNFFLVFCSSCACKENVWCFVFFVCVLYLFV